MSADHSEWVTYQLGDVGKVLTGKTPPGTEDKYFNGKTLFVTPTDMGNHREITETQRTLSTEGENVLYRVVFERGIVVSCIGWQMGKSAIINKKSATNQQINTVLPDEGKIDFDFLYYVLSSKRKEIFDLGATCTRTPILKKSAFEKITFKAPGINEQRAIAEILSSFDDKIELNRQINQTLEGMAQVIFKSWFVDFDPVKAKIEAKANGQDPERAAMCAISGKSEDELDQLPPAQLAQLQTTAALFPDELTDSELGLIPKGWLVKQLAEVINTTDYVANGSFASLKANVELFDEENEVLYVRTTDNNNGFVGNLKYTTLHAYEFLSKSKLFGRETIISNVGDVGTVFRPPRWLGKPMTLASNAVALITEKFNSYVCCYFLSIWGQHQIQSIVTGSAQLKFNKTNLRNLRILWPDENLLAFFENFELSLDEKNVALKCENTYLKNIRDTLLPKLLAGEIELHEKTQSS